MPKDNSNNTIDNSTNKIKDNSNNHHDISDNINEISVFFDNLKLNSDLSSNPTENKNINNINNSFDDISMNKDIKNNNQLVIFRNTLDSDFNFSNYIKNKSPRSKTPPGEGEKKSNENNKKINEQLKKMLNEIHDDYNKLIKDNYTSVFTDKHKQDVNKKINLPGYKFSWENLDKTTVPPPLKIEKKKITISVDVNNIEDLIKLADDYPLKLDVEYNIDMVAIHNIKPSLVKLNKMIGMNKLKLSIMDQIIFYIQRLHVNKNNKFTDFLHTVISGPPGTGKTEVAKIMGTIFSKLGILKKNKFNKVTRADLVAGYLGQTAIKTKEAIKNSLGGVLFIDEAYALGNSEKRDSFAKECIDTLCEGLSDHKEELMVIIAGYENELNSCFFSYNQGLDSRFTWRFKTDDYSYKELNLIFQKKVDEIGWKFKKRIKDRWFEDKMKYFKYYGRDMETLLAKVKIAHSRRVFCKSENDKMNITRKDMDKGFDMFIDNEEVKNRADKSITELMSSMYV